MTRDERTLRIMLELYCAHYHGLPAGQLCLECQSLQDYALSRLARCPFVPDKPVCAACPIHCYRPAERARIREVMRHAGPRLLFRAPGLALLHLLDRLRSRRRVERHQ